MAEGESVSFENLIIGLRTQNTELSKESAESRVLSPYK